MRPLALLLAVLAGCASDPVLDLQPGQRPPPHTAEAGLWMQMDRFEANLRSSGNVVRDEVLTAYVQGIACVLAPEYCKDMRVYVVRTPNFNASMAPNGVMQVWTGLIVRCENEAQLASVLGHEIAHFKRRHSIQQFEDMRRKSDGMFMIQLAAAAAGADYVGILAGMIANGTILAFSREQESEADALGLEMMTQAGYEPREAAKVWARVLDEQNYVSDERQYVPPVFLSSHPSGESRGAVLASLAESRPEGSTGRERFREVTRVFRAEMLRDEVRSRRFTRTQWLLSELLESGVDRALVEYSHGELYRARGQPGDVELALEWYRSATERPDAPPEAFRALGTLTRQIGERPEARSAFVRYLELAPQASDRKMIETYLKDLEDPQ